MEPEWDRDLTPDFEFAEHEDEDDVEESTGTDDNQFVVEDADEELVDRTWTFEKKKKVVDYYDAAWAANFQARRLGGVALGCRKFDLRRQHVARGDRKGQIEYRVSSSRRLLTFQKAARLIYRIWRNGR